MKIVTLENVFEAYIAWQEAKSWADKREANRNDVTHDRAMEDTRHRSYLYAVRSYDTFHPAIQVGKDIGS